MLTRAEAEPVTCFKDCPKQMLEQGVSGGHSSDGQWLLTGTMLGGVGWQKLGLCFWTSAPRPHQPSPLPTAENTYWPLSTVRAEVPYLPVPRTS